MATNVTTLVRIDDMGVPYGDHINEMEGKTLDSGSGYLQVGDVTIQGAHPESWRLLASIANEIADGMEKHQATAPDKVVANQEEEPAPTS